MVGSRRPSRRASQGFVVAWSVSVTMIASATQTTTSSASVRRPRATMIPASAAGTTPVSRVQQMKTISYARPAAAPVGQEARRAPRAGGRRRSAPRATASAGSPVVGDGLPGQVGAERDEDQHHHDVGDVRHEGRACRARGCECMPRRRMSMLPTISSGDERAEVAAAADRVDARRRPAATTIRTATAADSPQIPTRRLETTSDEHDPKPMPSAVEMPSSFRKSSTGAATSRPAVSDDSRDRQREHRARRVVERRLGDDRLRDLRPDAACARRAGSGSRGRSARARRRSEGRPPDGTSNRADATSPTTTAVMITPGIDEHAEPDRDAAENACRELQASVEEDERHAERQQNLDGDRLERDVDPARDRGAEDRAGGEQEQHHAAGGGGSRWAGRRARRRASARA